MVVASDEKVLYVVALPVLEQLAPRIPRKSLEAVHPLSSFCYSPSPR